MTDDRRPIMFVSLPESGLINTLLVLAAELSRRETPDLWFATDGHARDQVEARAEGSPIRFASLGEVVPELSAGTYDEKTYRAVTQRSRFGSHKAMIDKGFDPALHVGKYRVLGEIVDEVRPAVLVIDVMCTFAIDLAVTRGIPFVLSDPFLPSMWLSAHVPFGPSYTPKSFPVPHSGFPQRMTLRQRLENRLFRWRTLMMFLRPTMIRRMREDKRIVAELGIDPRARRSMAKIDEAALVLCYSLAELDYPFPIPDHVALPGAVVPPLPETADDDGLGAWLDARESVVFVGLGTNTRLRPGEVAAMVEAARRLRGHATILWKLPTAQQKLLPPAEQLPDNLRVESWVPSQLDVLAHPNVRAFVTHGGGNGFHEGLLFGLPMVVRPLWADCHDSAARGVDAGVSLTLDRPHTLDADDMVDKLTRVLGEPRFRERAEYFAGRLHEAGGRDAAADRILALPALARPVPA